MKIKKGWIGWFSLGVIGPLFCFGYFSLFPIKKETKNMEHYLRTAEVVSVEKRETGRTAPWRIKLDDGKTVRFGHFKHLDRRRPSLFADSYKYELAAYELNKLLQLRLVPPMVEREIEGTLGSLQLFIPNALSESNRRRKNMEPPHSDEHQNILEIINIFENLVYEEECLDADDILIQKEDWKVWRVDFSMAFSPVLQLIPGCQIRRCSQKLYQNLRKLDKKTLKNKLKPYLNKEEMDAVWKRKNLITEKIKQLIQEKGESSVLFPPF